MNPVPDVIERLRALFFRTRVERELDEELRDYIAREAEARARAGSVDAGREALVAFGGVERVKEEVREARGVLALEEAIADTRYALRALRRNPGFTLAVVAVLGIAIGAATAVFTVVDRVLLAGLPYPDADRLVRIYQQNSPANRWTLSAVDLQAVAAEQRSFEAFGGVRPASASLSGAGTPERIPIVRVTSGFFKALGGAAAAPGKFVTLDGVAHEVVGVLEPGRDELAGMRAPAWPALQLGTQVRRGPFGYRGIARLKRDVTLAEAARDLAGISARIFPIWKTSFQDSVAKLTPVPLRDAIVGTSDRQLGLFGGAVALVLLVAVANVATLMLVRTSAREHELSVRTALGAGRRRVARLIVTECVCLTVLAGAAGIAIAGIGLESVGFVAPNLPRLAEVTLDSSAVAFALLLALACGVLVSLAPLSSVLARGPALTSTLAGSPARAGAGRRANRLRCAFVVTEFAVALPLLMGAGLLFNSFLRLERVKPGFDPAGVYSVQLSLPSLRYPNNAAIHAFWRRAEARVAQVNGVTAVGLAASLPPDDYGDVNNFDLLDKPVPQGTTQPVSPWPPVTRGFFDALGIRLLEGRWIAPADSMNAPPVVLVSRSWAVKYYPHESALGKQMREGGCAGCPPTTVIGVVSDVHYRGLAGESDAVYPPLEQQAGGSMNLVVRSRLSPAATFRDLRSAVAALDPELAPIEVVMTDRLRAALGDPRRWTAVVGAFAVAGVVLAALGIFGLMSYVVRQRRREMGVRVALGAAPGSLTRLVVARGMRYALLGTGIGLVATAFESRWLGSLLFGVGATDPVTLAIATLVLLAIAALACWLPGLRAAGIKPIEALSTD